MHQKLDENDVPFEGRFVVMPPWYYSNLLLAGIGYSPSTNAGVKNVLGKLRDILADPPYNFYIHQGPNPNLPHEAWINLDKSYHWHMEIFSHPDKGGGIRVGDRLLHQPHAARACRAVPPGSKNLSSETGPLNNKAADLRFRDTTRQR
jgi:hypothetical protein